MQTPQDMLTRSYRKSLAQYNNSARRGSSTGLPLLGSNATLPAWLNSQSQQRQHQDQDQTNYTTPSSSSAPSNANSNNILSSLLAQLQQQQQPSAQQQQQPKPYQDLQSAAPFYYNSNAQFQQHQHQQNNLVARPQQHQQHESPVALLHELLMRQQQIQQQELQQQQLRETLLHDLLHSQKQQEEEQEQERRRKEEQEKSEADNALARFSTMLAQLRQAKVVEPISQVTLEKATESVIRPVNNNDNSTTSNTTSVVKHSAPVTLKLEEKTPAFEAKTIDAGETKKKKRVKKRPSPSNNTLPIPSRYRGVSWHRRDKVWLARVWIDGKIRHLGCFKLEKMAAMAVDLRHIALFGEHGRALNFPSRAERNRLIKEFKQRVDFKLQDALDQAQARMAADGDSSELQSPIDSLHEDKATDSDAMSSTSDATQEITTTHKRKLSEISHDDEADADAAARAAKKLLN